MPSAAPPVRGVDRVRGAAASVVVVAPEIRPGMGAGTVVAAGWVVTNRHVLARDAGRVRERGGAWLPARVIASAAAADLVLVRVEGLAAPPLRLATADEVRPGTPVVAIGHPWSIEGALAAGVVVSAGAAPGTPLDASGLLLTDLRLAPGNSGGPMLDRRGALLGISTLVAGGIGAAVPVSEVARLLDSAGVAYETAG